MVSLMGFVPGKRFRWDKMECGVGPLGVATGEEVRESRLVMKSENIRENRGFSGQTRGHAQLVRTKTFSDGRVWEFQNLYVNMWGFTDKLHMLALELTQA